jgi:hypothetical protein
VAKSLAKTHRHAEIADDTGMSVDELKQTPLRPGTPPRPEPESAVVDDAAALPPPEPAATAGVEPPAPRATAVAVPRSVSPLLAGLPEPTGASARKAAPAPVELPDPSLAAKDRAVPASQQTKRRLDGPAYLDGVSSSDVFQGRLGDCYLAAAASAVAQARPELAATLVEAEGNGAFRVRLFRFSSETGVYEPYLVRVDADLPADEDGELRYGRGTVPEWGTLVDSELWFPLLEKAMAVSKSDSYESLDHGGNPALALSELTGAWSDTYTLRNDPEAKVRAAVEAAATQRLPMVAWTALVSIPSFQVGVSGQHAYAVLGTVTDAKGQLWIELRNPNGSDEPPKNGPADGVFRLRWSDFVRVFSRVAVSRVDQL